jgi:hypothetical protein
VLSKSYNATEVYQVLEIASFASPLGPLQDTCRGLVKNVCPLFVMKGPRQPYLIGTGVPLQIGNVSVIATAAHVLARVGDASVLTFGRHRTILLSGERRGFGYVTGRHVDVDLAVIVLNDSEREALRQQVTFTYALQFARTALPQRLAFYGLVGFPHSRNKPSPRLLRETYAVANYFLSRTLLPLSKIKSEGKSGRVHFAIGAPRNGAIGTSGEPVAFPSTSGVSGGGVWRLDFQGSAGAAPIPKLVGIGIEYCRQPGAFVCTRVENTIEMVEDLQ